MQMQMYDANMNNYMNNSINGTLFPDAAGLISLYFFFPASVFNTMI